MLSIRSLVRRDRWPYLISKLLVKQLVLVRAELLLDEGQEDGDDDTCLERFSEDDEEDGDSEDLDHDGGVIQCAKRKMKVSRPGRSISLLEWLPLVYSCKWLRGQE